MQECPEERSREREAGKMKMNKVLLLLLLPSSSLPHATGGHQSSDETHHFLVPPLEIWAHHPALVEGGEERRGEDRRREEPSHADSASVPQKREEGDSIRSDWIGVLHTKKNLIDSER